MLERLSISTSQIGIREIRSWRDNDELCLDPPYQRGDVWGNTRRVNLIRSLITGVPVPSIVINDRFAARWSEGNWQNAVIDGKQRTTTILMFLDSELAVPGHWFESPDPTDMVTYNQLSEIEQRVLRGLTIGVCVCTLPDLDHEQEVFELINFGGVPQGESDE